MELAPLVRDVRRLATVEADPDRQLLERYLAGDAGAFAVLVRRHGPMVLGVCRRVLGHEQDAEDAFQATFLALAVRPESVRDRDVVGSFLHGVASRTARKTRSRRPRAGCEAVPDLPAAETPPEWMRSELAAVLDEEIARLPAWFREAFVLCHLEGRSAEQAARQLGCPRGTVLSRLARARQRLADRLRQRGITPGLLAVPLASLPPLLEEAVVEWAGRLLAGQPLKCFVPCRVLELILCGGKVSKIISCFLLLGLLAGFGAASSMVRRPGQPAALRSEAPPAVAAPDRKETAHPEKKGEAGKSEPESRLDVVLREWEKAAAATRSMRYRFTQIVQDKALQETHSARGEVQMLKPHLLRIDRWEGSKSTVLLFTEKSIHRYDSATKSERIIKKPADGSFLGEKSPEGSLGDFFSRKWMGDLFQQQVYWIYAGLPVRDLPRRFHVLLLKEDAYYVYLQIKPRRDKDRAAFERMRVVLRKKGFQVRQIWMEHVNGSESTIDFPKYDSKTKITPAGVREGLPRGWKRLAIPPDLNRPLPEK